MFKRLALFVALVAALAAPVPAAFAQGSLSDTYAGEDLVDSGKAFFGSASQGLASLVERAVSQFGLPNGYILGEDAGGALFAGARY
ncbi:MAG TPA: EipA family protein, partial [Devosia sp.]|nr:EipA family protein [Devosia sp.]